MSLNQYVTLGHSGLRVSPLCLGAMTFGKEWGWGSEPAEAKRVLPRVALSWLQNRPGVTSTIIGARTIEQLDDNVGALDVRLGVEQVAALDKASTPTLPFPCDMLSAVPAFAYGGTTINGHASKAWAQAPQNDSERF